MISRLIWKEWSEQRWKLLLGCVLLMGYTLIGLQARLIPDLATLAAGVFFYAIVFPVFVAMDVVAAERADGTLPALLHLPLPAWKIFLVKAAIAALVAVAPILLTAVAAVLRVGGREMTPAEILECCAAAACLAAVLLAWTLAFSVRQPTEARAAVIGLAVIAGLLLVATLYSNFDNLLPKWLMTLHPFGLLAAVDRPDQPWLKWTIPIQFAFAAVLLAWGAHRFAHGRIAAS